MIVISINYGITRHASINTAEKVLLEKYYICHLYLLVSIGSQLVLIISLEAAFNIVSASSTHSLCYPCAG